MKGTVYLKYRNNNGKLVVITIVYETDSEGLHLGYSLKSPKDQFVKKEGRRLALENLISKDKFYKFFKSSEYVDWNSETHKFIDQEIKSIMNSLLNVETKSHPTWLSKDLYMIRYRQLQKGQNVEYISPYIAISYITKIIDQYWDGSIMHFKLQNFDSLIPEHELKIHKNIKKGRNNEKSNDRS